MSEQQTRTADPAGLAGATEPEPTEQAPQPAPADPPAAADAGAKAKIEDVEEALRDVVDPELGINVVDLGLIYGLYVDDENTAIVDMTLTSAACPLTDVIEDQAQQALCGGPSPLVGGVRINWVWIPPWGPDKITDDGREQLRSLGFNV
ncbi:metal-sulfur cluster assembly factor [Actinocatenispora comari]|jgi:metal-sulfur cluster biosynthetic enzyme|uniref:MIP18 family-like domain-containing protein n=1 Tax=Actinocatenispora comari TaxID=2807577 RepID=A0A8J4EJN8_9ACTN|nr:metal-sulfur cluster assembly factor [Actinocatenispora comari]GIL26496.1 hypothetical protein NUM_17500 [Actinocatenispora comari]